MSEQEEIVQDESPQEQQIDYKAKYEEAMSKLESIAAHKDKLLSETKKAKQQREEMARQEEEKAKKAGEFEKLWNTSEERAKQVEQRYQELLKEIKDEKLQSNSMKLAVDLADGDASSAKLLSRFIKDSLSSLSDEYGNVDDGVINSIKKDFQNNKDFAPLIGGSKASGGSAAGNQTRGQSNQKTITRAQFEEMPLQDRMPFIKSGGKLSD